MPERRPLVLAIDDDESMCDLLLAGLSRHGYDVETRTNGADGMELLRQRDVDVVVTDIRLPGESGLDLCRRIVDARPDVPVILITAFGDMEAAVEAVRAGADDFIGKPLDIRVLAHSVSRAFRHRHLREEVHRLREGQQRPRRVGDLIGQSRPMREVYDLIGRLAQSDSSVLLTGESGTGKELVARALHERSPRASAPFAAINCAAMPQQLLESELFGHVKGAFTDAHTSREGLFERANGGTVLLDEIGDMPASMQATLLRVLQERTVRPVGGDRETPFDVRLVTATNRDLEEAVEQGELREDLFYRINVVQIHMPRLCERDNDVLLLAQHFIEKFASRSGKRVTGLSAEAARKLLEYDWPGNVRQLANTIERAVTLTRFEKITVDDLPPNVQAYVPTRLAPPGGEREPVLTLDELERRYIERVLQASGGNKSRAAQLLGLDRRTLYRKLDRWRGRPG